MKWRKHLKRKIDSVIGLTDRRVLDKTYSKYDDNRSGFVPNRIRSGYKSQMAYRYAKYAKTPLGRIEHSSRLGRVAVEKLLGRGVRKQIVRRHSSYTKYKKGEGVIA